MFFFRKIFYNILFSAKNIPLIFKINGILSINKQTRVGHEFSLYFKFMQQAMHLMFMLPECGKIHAR